MPQSRDGSAGLGAPCKPPQRPDTAFHPAGVSRRGGGPRQHVCPREAAVAEAALVPVVPRILCAPDRRRVRCGAVQRQQELPEESRRKSRASEEENKKRKKRKEEDKGGGGGGEEGVKKRDP